MPAGVLQLYPSGHPYLATPPHSQSASQSAGQAMSVLPALSSLQRLEHSFQCPRAAWQISAVMAGGAGSVKVGPPGTVHCRGVVSSTGKPAAAHSSKLRTDAMQEVPLKHVPLGQVQVFTAWLSSAEQAQAPMTQVSG